MTGDAYHNHAVVDHGDGDGDGNDELFRMPGDKVRTLARLVHLQEAQNIRKMTFRSTNHRTQYLRDSRKTYESAVRILDSIEEAKSKHQDDKEHSKLLDHLYKFASVSVGSACRTIWNLHLRDEYLKKIRAFAIEKENAFNEILSNTNLSLEAKLENFEGIIKELADHKQVSLDAMRSRQNPTSRNFSRFWRKLTYRHPENMFQHMVFKYQRKLLENRKIKMSDLEKEPFSGSMEEVGPLEPGKGRVRTKLFPDNAEVYNEIVASSGMPSHSRLVKFAKGAGRALLVFQLGMIVWDTCESSVPVMTLAKDTSSLVLSLGVGVAGEAVGTIVATTALGAFGVATTTLTGSGVVLAASVATGFGAAILAGITVGWLFTNMFESGKVAKKFITQNPYTEYSTVHPSTQHLMLHFTPIVNGECLARQLTAAATPKA